MNTPCTHSILSPVCLRPECNPAPVKSRRRKGVRRARRV